MPTKYAPSSPEQNASPEAQALDIRLRIIASADFLFSQLPNVDSIDPVAPVPVAEEPVRTVSRQLTNPIVQHVMNQPAMGQEAKDIIDEIYGAK